MTNRRDFLKEAAAATGVVLPAAACWSVHGGRRMAVGRSAGR
jgi:hypothetical protein